MYFVGVGYQFHFHHDDINYSSATASEEQICVQHLTVLPMHPLVMNTLLVGIALVALECALACACNLVKLLLFPAALAQL